jgi:2-C-methyl-D-erythritol 2,4-cyclodiphosphate synthase
MRVGHGYDVHKLVPGNKLILGGVDIPFPLGEEAFSDGDVLIHAVIDALFGAAALGDIGKHFPPGDEQYKDISSRILLKRALSILEEEGYGIANIDATVILQEPRILPYVQAMRENISEDLSIPKESVSIKGKTAERLGPVGRGESVEAHAVCLIEKR